MAESRREAVIQAVLPHRDDVMNIWSLAEIIADAIEVALSWDNEPTTDEVTT